MLGALERSIERRAKNNEAPKTAQKNKAKCSAETGEDQRAGGCHGCGTRTPGQLFARVPLALGWGWKFRFLNEGSMRDIDFLHNMNFFAKRKGKKGNREPEIALDREIGRQRVRESLREPESQREV